MNLIYLIHLSRIGMGPTAPITASTTDSNNHLCCILPFYLSFALTRSFSFSPSLPLSRCLFLFIFLSSRFSLFNDLRSFQLCLSSTLASTSIASSPITFHMFRPNFFRCLFSPICSLHSSRMRILVAAVVHCCEFQCDFLCSLPGPERDGTTSE